jgi:hypothetical protein
MPWHAATYRKHFTAHLGTGIVGLLLGATAALMIDQTFTRPPITFLAAPTGTEKGGRGFTDSPTYFVVGGSLEMHYRFVRSAECNSVSQVWLWKWIEEGTGHKQRYFVPMQTTFVTLSDVSPVIQEFIVALSVPPAVTPGQWFLRTKSLDYCRPFAWVFGPTIRRSNDVPVTVLPPQEPIK